MPLELNERDDFDLMEDQEELFYLTAADRQRIIVSHDNLTFQPPDLLARVIEHHMVWGDGWGDGYGNPYLDSIVRLTTGMGHYEGIRYLYRGGWRVYMNGCSPRFIRLPDESLPGWDLHESTCAASA